MQEERPSDAVSQAGAFDMGSLKARVASLWRDAEPDAVSQDRVLGDELRAVSSRRDALDLPPLPDVDEAYDPDRAFDSGLFGLSLSGGGIRSATFNLGVLQTLARYGLLSRIDYLSTVSGGGYIGGWLTALLQRTFTGKKPALSFDALGFRAFERKLAWSAGDASSTQDGEHAAISFLRQFSNYLTPKLGIFSGDSWSLLSIYLRNALLNQIVLVMALAVGLLGPRFLSLSIRELETVLIGVLAALLALYALWALGRNIAAISDTRTAQSSADDTAGVVLRIVIPTLAIGVCFVRLLPAYGQWFCSWSSTCQTPIDFSVDGNYWALSAAVGAVGNAAVWAGAAAVALAGPWKKLQARGFWRTAVLAAVPAGALLGLLLGACASFLASIDYAGYGVSMAPPLVTLALLTSAIVHIGLAGNGFDSRHREWLSRLGGLMGIGALAWAVAFGLVFMSALCMDMLPVYTDKVLAGGWLATTLAGVYAGKTSEGNSQPKIPKRILMAVAPWAFIAGLLIILSAGLQALLRWAATVLPVGGEAAGAIERSYSLYADRRDAMEGLSGVPWGPYGNSLQATENFVLLLSVLIPAAILAFWFSRRVDINSFSLHNMYANRIVRCFLGATDSNRSSNPFTGFSPADDMTMFAGPRQVGDTTLFVHESAEVETQALDTGEQPSAAAYPGPYHLVSTAINLAGGKNLAWQERKAGSFVLSPLYCGFRLPGEDRSPAGQSPTYRPTRSFASVPRHLTLGEAVATSGAAASPNMGYHTTPALAFLMGVFNIRLGRWVANPKGSENYPRDNWRKSGPKFALWHLLCEVFGLTDDESSFVYLSDGGHFENLGLYELVRRRCRYVIVSDSGADPNYNFEDLGNAIRKCRIDLGIEIDIDVQQIARIGDQRCNSAPCAIGKIRYSADRVGTLLYIKSSRRMHAPSDVVQYARQHEAFPHESTSDQFFSESQFESYRRLGRFLAEEVVVAAIEDEGEVELPKLFQRLEQNWYASSAAVSQNFSALSTQIDTLFERLRESEELKFLHEQFYPEWRTLLEEPSGRPALHTDEMWELPAAENELRHGFYFCNSLIQLMENVYLDLNLESEHMHPDNSGWMNVFRHWTWSSMFRITWAISAATYGRRFREFCRRRLNLSLGEVAIERVYAGSPDASGLRPALEDGRLNLVEREQVALLLADRRDGDGCRIYRIDLRVERMFAESAGGDAGNPYLRCFGVGYALILDETLIMYRVQDHLRGMELGRLGLKQLIAVDAMGGHLRLDSNVEEHLRAIGERADRKLLAQFRADLWSAQH
jgi:hypothetical protein